MFNDRKTRQIELLRNAFLKQDRDSVTYYVYYNDERYYVVLSSCEDMDIRFAVKSNCIIVEAAEFERVVPPLHKDKEDVAVSKPAKQPVVFMAKMPETANISLDDARVESVAHPSDEAEEADDIEEDIASEEPEVAEEEVEPEPLPSITKEVQTQSRSGYVSILKKQPAVQEEKIVPTPKKQAEPKKSVTERLAEVTAKSNQTREESASARRKTLDMREQSVREREIAVYEREVAADSREEEIEDRRALMQARRHELEAREETLRLFSEELTNRQRFLASQQQDIAQLKKHINNVVRLDFFPAA